MKLTQLIRDSIDINSIWKCRLCGYRESGAHLRYIKAPLLNLRCNGDQCSESVLKYYEQEQEK